jgi:hypothetical protein
MFSIYRSQSAVTPLREAWEGADEPLREAILQASHRLDQQLAREPDSRGESRDERTRILFEAPVAVLFEVHQEEKLVRIVRAWLYRAGVEGRGRQD